MKTGDYRAFGMTVPEETIASINRYLTHGIPTGGFLEAVIDNDLHLAVSRADDRNIYIIPAIVSYLYNEAPVGSWGRAGCFEAWMNSQRAWAASRPVGADNYQKVSQEEV